MRHRADRGRGGRYHRPHAGATEAAARRAVHQLEARHRQATRGDLMSYIGEGETRAEDLLLRRADDAPSVTFGSGATARFVAPGSTTAGGYGLFRWHAPAHSGGPKPHFHRTFSEAFYILSGSMEVMVGVRTGRSREQATTCTCRRAASMPFAMTATRTPRCSSSLPPVHRASATSRSSRRSRAVDVPSRRTSGPSCMRAMTSRWSDRRAGTSASAAADPPGQRAAVTRRPDSVSPGIA